MSTAQASAGREGVGTVDERAFLAGVALTALATTLMLESTRVFVAYLVFVVDQSNRLVLGAIAFAVFAATGLARLFMRGDDFGRLLLVSAGLLASSRLVLQFLEEPVARVALGAAGIVAWGWCCVALLSAPAWRRACSVGLVGGLTLDILLRVAFGTVDLPWLPTTTKDAWTAVLAAMLVFAVAVVTRRKVVPEQQPGDSRPLLAVGPGLALYHLFSGNIGLAMVALDVGAQATRGFVMLGAVLPLLLLAAPSGLSGGWRPRRWNRNGVFMVLGALGLWLTWPRASSAPSAILGVWFVTIANFMLLAHLLQGSASTRSRTSRRSIAFWFTAGLAFQAVLLFAYYTFSGPAVVVGVTYLALCGGVVLTRGWAPMHVTQLRMVQRASLVVVVVGGLASATSDVDWDEPTRGRGLPAEFTIMTYNLQNGFAKDERFNLEGQARVIEAQQPDIVVLQEVSRGWLVTGGVDMLLWLSQRLDMPYVWGPASRDDLWGNAILSRAPLTNAEVEKFSRTQNLRRSVVRVQVLTETGDVWIFGTHLDNPSGAGAVREEQVAQILEFRGDATPALLLGDFNAVPDDPVIQAVEEAGFVDLGETLPSGTFTSEGRSRIDYIFATDELTAVSIQVVESEASDHKPVVARVRR